MNLYDLSHPSKKKKQQLAMESRLAEFAADGGGDSGNYFQALASAWYNGTFDTGSLKKGIKSQQDVERLLNRGIVCPDGVTRKLHIDYNSDFNGVEIYSDDYYEHGDHDDTIDSRTGQKWGPYDHMEFSDDQLDEATGDQKFDSMMSQMTAEPKYPDQDMPPTSVSELIQWAGRNNKPYHEYFAQWARRNKFTNVNDALVWFGDNVDPSNPWGPKDFVDPFGRPAAEELEDAAKHDPKAAELMKVFRCYEEIVFDWPDEYRQMNMPDSRKGTDEGVAEGNMDGKVADIKGQIAELEAEQEENEFGSYAYDTVNGELQYLYAKLDKAEKGVAEGNMDGKVADIKGQIAELEAEQEENEFGSYAYDTVNGELQYLYAKLDKAEKGVAEGSLNEFAPDGFNGDDDEGFSPEIAKMAQEDGFTKGVSLADGATLERAITINHWHNQHGGMYKQYFAKGFKAGRMNKVRHDNKQYNLNLKLMKDGSIRHGEQGVAEGAPISGDGGAVDNFKQQMANNTELAYQKKQQGMAEGDTVVKHRIGLTVTDPNHPMASKRNEPIQKTVRVPGDDPAKAINAAIAHYRRKGYKVHDHHYMGTVDYTIDEAAPDWLRRTAGAATGALAGVGASFPGAAIAGPIGGAVAGAYGAKAGYDLGADAADWVYDKVAGKRVPADKAEVDEELTMKHQRAHTTQRRPDISNSLADRDFDMSEKPNVAKSADGHPTVKWRHHGHAGHTRVEPTLNPTTVQRKDARPIPSFLKKGVAEGGYQHGFADPNAPSLGSSGRKDDEGNSEFDDRQRRQTGMIFYKVDDAELAQQLGLKQTRAGKWYLRTGNRHAQQTADRAFGLGRIWYPESVEEAGVFGFMDPTPTVKPKPKFTLSQIRDLSKQDDEKTARYVRSNDLPKNPDHMRVVHDDVKLGELSNELLGRYKKELGIRASAADRAGDYDRGHEYFKKINRATVRQGDNDARRHAEKDMMETRLNMMRKAGYDL